ncbi:MAG: hypothetical protein IJL72_08700 [Lachnospiraceae bacterium]|nr:hypothetical protein [Lachnospiraceae bacterium]
MNWQAFSTTYSSDSTAGAGNQVLTCDPEPVTRTGRAYFRLRCGGENYAMLFSNRTDSTFSDGSISRANEDGEAFDILSLRIGLCKTYGEEPETFHAVTFGGDTQKHVLPGEIFTTDPVPLRAQAGEYLVYEICVRGRRYPYHEEIILTITPTNKVPVPLMIGAEGTVRLRAGFLGDSITQGIGTEFDSYTHWVERIAEGLPSDVSVWDLGIGYARCSDAAEDGFWLARAKTCDIVTVCFGVNDLLQGHEAAQVMRDLTIVVSKLKEAGCRVILFTLPPFDYEPVVREKWDRVNRYVREELSKKADGLFEMARVLGQPAPNEHRTVYGGHPNAEGSAKVAEAFLAQFLPYYKA